MPRGKARKVVVETRKAYKYIHGRKWEEIEDRTNEAIAEGYVPIGGVSVTSNYLYSQALMDREMVVALLAEAVAQGMPMPDKAETVFNEVGKSEKAE